MANIFKTTSQQYGTHVSAGNNVKVVSSWFHNLSAMTKQTSSKTGRNRIDNIVDHFNIDPTSLIDDNVRQHKKPKVTSVDNSAKPDAIDIGVSFETQMEKVISEPSLCYPNFQHVPQMVDLQPKQSLLGTLACPKNEEGRTGAYAQTHANTTDRQNQNRQTQAEQTDAIGSNKTQTEVRQGDNNRIETDKRRHRRNEQRTTKITIRSCRRRRIN
jgi:hypothetical protein